MAASSATLHEPVEKLKPETPNIHRALVSLMEELEAIDWYRQRADACSEDQLKAILEHNLNEEIEHAAHYNITLSESLVLKIKAPNAICTITPKGPVS